MNEMIIALEKKYVSDIAHAKANISVYLNNPVGIGEHPDLVSAIDSQVELIAHASDKLEVLQKHYEIETEYQSISITV